ncbi:hypothetical protein [Thalassoroseus pseudoceratinae]|uniref:hypothetical protein n=1 Tax=Thalassoroseus pseudoceratinae TaxID=2713176 RepID=UPI00141DD9D7|nr:hypothetical protein [Thalassoroseus pseudoceratinae]
MRQSARLLIIAHVLTYAATTYAADELFRSPTDLAEVFRPTDEPFCRFDTSSHTDLLDTESTIADSGDESARRNPTPRFDSATQTEIDFIQATEPIVIRAQNGSMFGAGTRLRFDYSEDYNDEVRIHGQLMTQLTGQFGLDAESTWYDKTRNSDIDGELWTGDANLVYKMDVSRITLRFGGGAAYALKDGRADVGYNMTYGTDFYIRRPFLVSGEIDWGEISGDQLFHWRVTTGFVYGSLEIFAGYDSYELGEFDINGPVAGLGIVF